jgi:hypothetical protein
LADSFHQFAHLLTSTAGATMQRDTRTTAHGRIQKDLREVNDKLNPDSPPIHALPVGDALDHVDALIIGPPETPYSFGFFRFGTFHDTPSLTFFFF